MLSPLPCMEPHQGPGTALRQVRWGGTPAPGVPGSGLAPLAGSGVGAQLPSSPLSARLCHQGTYRARHLHPYVSAVQRGVAALLWPPLSVSAFLLACAPGAAVPTLGAESKRAESRQKWVSLCVDSGGCSHLEAGWGMGAQNV
ncbi:hypothetical protein P7K49_002059 [Saguinus oedipus]|uniref:Uncharacterized protein n=1 Tax=Saguinus oedipus TaxID=9490 RepID=A0ABQ9WG85_SAGOE|nr:hypothetical protein P7K49_002059 [Saguinus oedipus]